MSADMPAHPHMPSWRVKRQIYLYYSMSILASILETGLDRSLPYLSQFNINNYYLSILCRATFTVVGRCQITTEQNSTHKETFNQVGDYRTTDVMGNELPKQSSRVLNKICHQHDEICRCAELEHVQNALPGQSDSQFWIVNKTL